MPVDLSRLPALPQIPALPDVTIADDRSGMADQALHVTVGAIIVLSAAASSLLAGIIATALLAGILVTTSGRGWVMSRALWGAAIGALAAAAVAIAPAVAIIAALAATIVWTVAQFGTDGLGRRLTAASAKAKELLGLS